MDATYNYFKKGFEGIQEKLNRRFYISVAVFAADISQVLNEIAFSQSLGESDEFPPKPVSEQLNATDRAKHKATQKDRLARAKRIIKVIKDDLIDAAAKEADLGMRLRDEECEHVSSILEHALQASLDLTHINTDGEAHDGVSEGAEDELQILQPIDANAQSESAIRGDKLTNGIIEEDIEMADAPSTEPNQNAEHESGIHLNGLPNGVAAPGSSEGRDLHDAVDLTFSHSAIRITPGLNVPALSNSGSTNHSTTTHDPLTPPDGAKELTGLNQGGVPWYLEGFAPHGTTVYEPEDDQSREEHVAVNEPIRSVSEELSELDDDAVNGLVDGLDKQHTVNGSGPTLAVPTATPKKKAKSKRRR